MRMGEFPLQLFASEKMPRPELFREIHQEPYLNKPRCGLWTSTFIDAETGSGWIRWCVENWFRPPPDHGWLLRPADDARILQIDSLDDLVSVTTRFRRKFDPEYASLLSSGAISDELIDFHAVALEYDGMRVTQNGMLSTHFSRPYNLYGWDCEATVWFQWVFAPPEKVQLNIQVDELDKEWINE